MAGIKDLSQYGMNAGENGFAVDAGGAPEGWLGKDVNNVLREFMAVVRTFYNDPEFLNLNWTAPNTAAAITRLSTTQFTVGGLNATTWMTPGRRLEYIGATTAYGTIVSSSFSTDTTVTVAMDAGDIPAAGSPSKARVHLAKTIPGATFVGQTPTGTILDYVGTTIPTGYLACDGAAVSRSTYPGLLAVSTISGRTGSTNSNTIITSITVSTADLFAGMGIEGGSIPAGATIVSVDSSTQVTISAAATTTASASLVFFPHGRTSPTLFNVIDLGGYTPIGFKSAGDGDGDYRGIGRVYGAKNVTLTVNQLAAHTHGGITGDDSPDHTHSVQQTTTIGTSFSNVGANLNYITSSTGGAVPRHQHSIAAAGANGSHENRQLSKVVNKIIKT